MPTYEYRCLSCSHEFEAFQNINAERLKECPQCGKEVKRLISAGAGILFKGSGFYITDYRSKGYQEQVKKESDSTPKTTADSSKTTADSSKTTTDSSKTTTDSSKTTSSNTPSSQPAKKESSFTSP